MVTVSTDAEIWGRRKDQLSAASEFREVGAVSASRHAVAQTREVQAGTTDRRAGLPARRRAMSPAPRWTASREQDSRAFFAEGDPRFPRWRCASSPSRLLGRARTPGKDW